MQFRTVGNDIIASTTRINKYLNKPTTVELINAVRKSNLPKHIKQELVERLEQWAENNL